MKEVKITTQKTTNETIIKFITNSSLINGGSYEYNNIDEAKDSPLAQQLFYLPFVKRIFITANFIAIQRYDIVEWDDVEEAVKEQLKNYLQEDGNIVAVMKFGTNTPLTEIDVEYKNIEEASKSSPLAAALFSFPFIKEVFISENYISLTKFDVVEWGEVHQEVRTSIRTYLQQGKVIISEYPKKETQEVSDITPENLDEISSKIISILDEYIKPAVASDGGNIAFKAYNKETKNVSVVLQGACSGCPSSTATLKNGIEAMLKEMLPNQINDVIAING